MSVVSGTGISGNIIAFTTYSVLVTAKDSSGNNIGHGGDSFYVEIYNKWTVDSNMNWNTDAGARQTLTTPIKGAMTDNGDGTYSFSYSVVLDGAVTVVVKLENKGIINWRWYSNTVFDVVQSPSLSSPLVSLGKSWSLTILLKKNLYWKF